MKTLEKNKLIKHIFAFITFLTMSVGQTLPNAIAQEPALSPPEFITLIPVSVPPVIKGLKIHTDNPLHFDFIIDTGTSKLNRNELTVETTKLIKYFMASLTVPENELWVNLSPYEKNRIIPDAFGITEMGRDLLTQDYMLKQITASLLDPQKDLGKKFWDHVYQVAKNKNIPVTTFNKVWIVPDQAIVDQSGDTAFVIRSHLKVLLESDYAALQRNSKSKELADHGDTKTNIATANIVREIILPEIEREVNTGENFTQLRQVYNSLILAIWFKQNLKESVLGKVYAEKNKVVGVDINDKTSKEKIYQKYLNTFKTGVYSFIKEEIDPQTQETIPRKYFSGGFDGREAKKAISIQAKNASSTVTDVSETLQGKLIQISAILNPVTTIPSGQTKSASSSPIDSGFNNYPIVPVRPGEVVITERNTLKLDEEEEYQRDHYPGNGHGNNNFIYVLGDGSVLRVHKRDYDGHQLTSIGPRQLALIERMGELGLSPELITTGYARNPDPLGPPGPFYIQQVQIYGEDLARLVAQNNGLLDQADMDLILELFKGLIDNHIVILDIQKFDNVMIGTTKYNSTRKAYAHDLDYVEQWKDKSRNEIIDFYIKSIENSSKHSEGDHSWATADPKQWMLLQLKLMRSYAASSSAVGGIDLNPKQLNLKTTGNKIDFNLPANPEEIKQLLTAPLYGFSPVIIQMTPVTSLPSFLGISNVSQ